MADIVWDDEKPKIIWDPVKPQKKLGRSDQEIKTNLQDTPQDVAFYGKLEAGDITGFPAMSKESRAQETANEQEAERRATLDDATGARKDPNWKAFTPTNKIVWDPPKKDAPPIIDPLAADDGSDFHNFLMKSVLDSADGTGQHIGDLLTGLNPVTFLGKYTEPFMEAIRQDPVTLLTHGPGKVIANALQDKTFRDTYHEKVKAMAELNTVTAQYGDENLPKNPLIEWAVDKPMEKYAEAFDKYANYVPNKVWGLAEDGLQSTLAKDVSGLMLGTPFMGKKPNPTPKPQNLAVGEAIKDQSAFSEKMNAQAAAYLDAHPESFGIYIPDKPVSPYGLDKSAIDAMSDANVAGDRTLATRKTGTYLKKDDLVPIPRVQEKAPMMDSGSMAGRLEDWIETDAFERDPAEAYKKLFGTDFEKDRSREVNRKEVQNQLIAERAKQVAAEHYDHVGFEIGEKEARALAYDQLIKEGILEESPLLKMLKARKQEKDNMIDPLETAIDTAAMRPEEKVLDNAVKAADLADAIKESKTTRELADALEKWAPEGPQKGLMAKIKEALNHRPEESARVVKPTDKDAADMRNQRGVVTTEHGTGEVRVRLRGEGFGLRTGLDYQTPAHELAHVVTNDAFYIARNKEFRDLPEYKKHVKFSDRVQEIYEKVADTLGPEVRRLEPFRTLNEFVAYGWTNPRFREILGTIQVDKSGRSVWQKMTDALADFLGLDKKQRTALEELDSLQDSLNDIQSLNREVVGSALATRDMTSMKDAPKQVKEQAKNLTSPYKTWGEMKEKMGTLLYDNKIFSDVSKLSSNIYPVTMVKDVTNNPGIQFTVSQLRQIYGDGHVLKVQLLARIKEFEKAPKDQQNRIVLALNELNRPEWQDQFKVQGVKDLPDALLQQFGMQPQDVPLYRATLDPLFKALIKIDDKSLQRSFGRALTSDVVNYYPRSFGYGRFSISGYNSTGQQAFYRRTPTFKEAAQLELELQAQGMNTSRMSHRDGPTFKDHLLGLIEADPGASISRTAKRVIDSMEEYKRKQEMERNAHGVAGYVGQKTINPLEVDLLRQAIYHRLENTVETYKAARYLDEILRPVQADPLFRMHYPEATRWIQDVIRRELGSDISGIKMVDTGIQWAFDRAHRAYMNTFQNMANKVRPDEFTLDPRGSKEVVKYSSAVASGYALIGNIPNMIVNMTAIPLVSLLGGFPDAGRFTQNPAKMSAVAAKSHGQAVADLGNLMIGTADKGTRDFFKTIEERGLLTANMFNDLPQFRTPAEKTPVAKGIEAAINVPRKYLNDPIEYQTNLAALLFYRRFFENLDTGWSKQQQFRETVNLAKKYTGDYGQYNRALIYDKLGTIGSGIGNFSTWIGTRLAQMHSETKLALTTGNTVPLVTLLASQLAIAGLQGLPGMQDYENLRQWIGKHFDKLLPPLDLVYKQIGAPEWLRNGVIMNSTPLDLSGRGKWAGFSELGGVTALLPEKVYDLTVFINQYLQEQTPEGASKDVGTSVQSTSDAVKALPYALQGPATQFSLTRSQGDRNTVLGRQGQAVYTQTGKEKYANMIGFKSKRQAEEVKDFYNTEYLKREYTQEIAKMKKKGIEQMLAGMEEATRGNEANAKTKYESARVNLENLSQKDPDAFKTFRKDLLAAYNNQNDDVETRRLKELIKTDKAGRIIQLLNSVKIIDQTKQETGERKALP